MYVCVDIKMGTAAPQLEAYRECTKKCMPGICAGFHFRFLFSSIAALLQLLPLPLPLLHPHSHSTFSGWDVFLRLLGCIFNTLSSRICQPSGYAVQLNGYFEGINFSLSLSLSVRKDSLLYRASACTAWAVTVTYLVCFTLLPLSTSPVSSFFFLASYFWLLSNRNIFAHNAKATCFILGAAVAASAPCTSNSFKRETEGERGREREREGINLCECCSNIISAQQPAPNSGAEMLPRKMLSETWR